MITIEDNSLVFSFPATCSQVKKLAQSYFNEFIEYFLEEDRKLALSQWTRNKRLESEGSRSKAALRTKFLRLDAEKIRKVFWDRIY